MKNAQNEQKKKIQYEEEFIVIFRWVPIFIRQKIEKKHKSYIRLKICDDVYEKTKTK